MLLSLSIADMMVNNKQQKEIRDKETIWSEFSSQELLDYCLANRQKSEQFSDWIEIEFFYELPSLQIIEIGSLFNKNSSTWCHTETQNVHPTLERDCIVFRFSRTKYFSRTHFR